MPAIFTSYISQNSVNVGGTNYRIPDQTFGLYNLYVDSSGEAEYFTSDQQIGQSLSKELSKGFSQSSAYMQGMFSTSRDALFFEAEHSLTGGYTASTDQQVKVVTISLVGLLNTTEDFLISISNLPTSFNSNTCSLFKSFISKYGTHYLRQVLYGGVVSMNSVFSAEVLKYRETSVVADLEVQFKLLTCSGSLSPEELKMLEELNLLYSSKVHLEGGSSYYQPNQWVQWVNTVSSNAVHETSLFHRPIRVFKQNPCTQ